MAALNLKYCKITSSGVYYDIMVAVTDLDNLDIAIQEAASGVIGEYIDLPVGLVKVQNISEVLPSYSLNNYVYTGE